MVELRPYSKEDYIDIFADNLVELMEEKGFDKATLAKEAHITEGTIERWLERKNEPTVKSVINLAHALNCGIEYLIDFGATIE